MKSDKSDKSTSPSTETRKKAAPKAAHTPETAPIIKELNSELKGIAADATAFAEAQKKCLEEMLRPTPAMLRVLLTGVKAGREFISTWSAAVKAAALVITNAKNSVGALVVPPGYGASPLDIN